MQREIKEMLDRYLIIDHVTEMYKMEASRRVGLEENIRSLIVSEKEKVIISMFSLVREAWGMNDD